MERCRRSSSKASVFASSECRSGPDGAIHAKEIVRHPGAVRSCRCWTTAACAWWRTSAPRWAAAAGIARRHPRARRGSATARRELGEETGYVAGQIRLLTTFYMSPGILDEEMRLYLATS